MCKKKRKQTFKKSQALATTWTGSQPTVPSITHPAGEDNDFPARGPEETLTILAINEILEDLHSPMGCNFLQEVVTGSARSGC